MEAIFEYIPREAFSTLRDLTLINIETASLEM